MSWVIQPEHFDVFELSAEELTKFCSIFSVEFDRAKYEPPIEDIQGLFNEVLVPAHKAVWLDWKWDPEEFINDLNTCLGEKLFRIHEDITQTDKTYVYKAKIKLSIKADKLDIELPDVYANVFQWVDLINEKLEKYTNYQLVYADFGGDDYTFVLLNDDSLGKVKAQLEQLWESRKHKARPISPPAVNTKQPSIEEIRAFAFAENGTKDDVGKLNNPEPEFDNLFSNKPAPSKYFFFLKIYSVDTDKKVLELAFSGRLFAPIASRVMSGETLKEGVSKHLMTDYHFSGDFAVLSAKFIDKAPDREGKQRPRFLVKVVVPKSSSEKIHLDNHGLTWKECSL